MADPVASNASPWENAAPQAGYQSLSVLAVASMVVGGIFGIFVIVGSLVAFVGTSPFLLPVWSAMFPAIALLLGWMALARIRDSAGVLTGSRFAWTGINISLITALLYFTYFLANNLAVRQQANEFVQSYFEAVATKPPEQAYLYVLQPAQRPQNLNDPARIRALVEATYNVAGDPGQPGAFTRYQFEPYVRTLTNSGGQFEAKLLRANLPDFTEGGYVVPMTYQIKTQTVDMIIEFSVQSASTNQGRQWFVKPVGVATRKLNLTPEGEKQEKQAKAATTAAENFVKALTKLLPGKFSADPDFDTAFLQTVPGAALADKKSPEALKKGRDAFFGPVALDKAAGRFAYAPADKFYCDTTIKADLLAEVSKALTPGSGFTPYMPNWIGVGNESNLPRVTESGGVSQYRTDVSFQFAPYTSVTGKLLLETIKGAPPEDSKSWRIAGAELIRAKIVSRPRDAPR